MKKKAKRPAATGLLLIALFKLVKGILLVAVGIGALKLLHRDVAAVVTHWVDILRVDPGNRFIHRLVERAFSVNPKQLKELSAGTFFYASLLLTEGVGLLLRKSWAEYFTVITTTVFIPLEIYELARRFTPARLGVLALNVAIVWYLVRRLRHRSTEEARSSQRSAA